MFKLDKNGTTLVMHKGNTGTLRIHLNGYSFGPSDRAYFAMGDGKGTIVKSAICEIVNGCVEIAFANADTKNLAEGSYPYGLTVATDPVYDDGKIVNGSCVITPDDDHVVQIVDTTALI